MVSGSLHHGTPGPGCTYCAWGACAGLPMKGLWELAGLSSSGLWEREEEPEDVLSRYRPEQQGHSQFKEQKITSTTLLLCSTASSWYWLPSSWGKPHRKDILLVEWKHSASSAQVQQRAVTPLSATEYGLPASSWDANPERHLLPPCICDLAPSLV